MANQHEAVRHTDIRSNNTSKKGWNLRSKRFVLSRKRSRKTDHTPTWLHIHIPTYCVLYIDFAIHVQKKNSLFTNFNKIIKNNKRVTSFGARF